MVPPFAAGFDGPSVKALTGGSVQRIDDDTLLSTGLGIRYFPTSWFSASVFQPYKWSRWNDKASGRTQTVSGAGDLSFGVQFDLLEYLQPTLIRARCPETGGWILARRDDDRLLKSPHLTLAGGVSAPVGRHDVAVDNRVASALYQPGAGVWMQTAGLFYSQGVGSVTPSIGGAYLFSGAMNSAGYDRPDNVTLVASASWLAWPARLGKVYAGLNLILPVWQGKMRQRKPGSILQAESEQIVALDGSDKKMVLMDLGWSMWVCSYWKKQKKVHLGTMLTIPLVEGESATEPRNGWALSLFLVLNL